MADLRVRTEKPFQGPYRELNQAQPDQIYFMYSKPRVKFTQFDVDDLHTGTSLVVCGEFWAVKKQERDLRTTNLTGSSSRTLYCSHGGFHAGLDQRMD